ncbi:hypothetical protein D3C87_1769780 [compost metagenome]
MSVFAEIEISIHAAEIAVDEFFIDDFFYEINSIGVTGQGLLGSFDSMKSDQFLKAFIEHTGEVSARE